MRASHPDRLYQRASIHPILDLLNKQNPLCNSFLLRRERASWISTITIKTLFRSTSFTTVQVKTRQSAIQPAQQKSSPSRQSQASSCTLRLPRSSRISSGPRASRVKTTQRNTTAGARPELQIISFILPRQRFTSTTSSVTSATLLNPAPLLGPYRHFINSGSSQLASFLKQFGTFGSRPNSDHNTPRSPHVVIFYYGHTLRPPKNLHIGE
ncbi:hypothetical protein BKA65DRAFT_6742 [Rhexocercosporidium sp. MPI-PUGE-AT-0058]|nr:hypothetical protein BKA65DRAFT_6742 [Rhexocercosporidium sp. MPI-PUGE-AT-0058]